MRTASKRFFSFLLVAVMVLSAIPFAAFADAHICGSATEVRSGLGIYKCACGKFYHDADCTGAALSAADLCDDANLIAYMDALDAAGDDAGYLALMNELGLNPGSGSAPGPATPPPISPLTSTDTVYVKFVLNLEGSGDLPTNSAKPGDPDQKCTGALGYAYSAGNFYSALTAANLNYYDYLWPSQLEFKRGDVKFEAGKTLNALPATSDGTFTDAYGNTYPVYIFKADVKLKHIKVTVQADWTEGTTPKTYKISELTMPLKDCRNVEMIDFLYGTLPTGTPATVPAFDYTNLVKGAVNAHDIGGNDISGFDWGESNWYANGSKLYPAYSQKFTGDVVLSAKLSKPATVTVKFHPEGGTCSVQSAPVTTDKGYNLPTPTKSGFVFMGWYETAVDNAIDHGDTSSVTATDYEYSADTKSIKLTAAATGANKKITHYYNSTPITKDTDLYAMWLPEAKITLHVYKTKSLTETPTTVTLTGIPVGAKLTQQDITNVLTNASYSGPFNKDNSEAQNYNWGYYVGKETAFKYLIGETLTDATYDLAVHAPYGTTKTPAASNPNANPNGSTTPTNSSATYDPSNPKTGDLAADRLNMAAFALIFSVTGLAGVYMFSRKKNFGL